MKTYEQIVNKDILEKFNCFAEFLVVFFKLHLSRFEDSYRNPYLISQFDYIAMKGSQNLFTKNRHYMIHE